MKKITLPFLIIIRSKGKLYPYYRRGKNRQRIYGEIGSTEFIENYNGIHKTHENSTNQRTHPHEIMGTLSWIINNYKNSPRFENLKPSTQKHYNFYLQKLEQTYGYFDIRTLTRPAVIAIRDKHLNSQGRQRIYVQLLKILSEYAIDRGLRTDNPAKGVSYVGKLKGWRAWTDEELSFFEENCKNSQLLFAFRLALYTGQRQGDLLKMQYSDIKSDHLAIVQNKTGMAIKIPMHQKLLALIGSQPNQSGYLIKDRRGKKYKSTQFSSLWSRKMKDLSLDCTFHGLRRNAAKALAEAGCTEKQIMAVTGHQTSAMVMQYIKEANQTILAQSAMNQLEESKNSKTDE